MTTPVTRKRPTHLDARGRARMVDVGAKEKTERVARAEAIVSMNAETLELVRENATPKGDVLAAARIAGIQAGKRTPEWIPLCHTVALSSLAVDIEPSKNTIGLRVETTARAMDRTGVEMEALVAASAAALTIYDMLKSVDRSMTFSVRLLEKRGGKSGVYRAQARKRR